MTSKRIRRWSNASPDWIGTQAQDLSPLTLILAAFGPGVLAFVVVQAGAGYWTAAVAFVILEASALLLVRRDYLRRESAEDTPTPGTSVPPEPG
jgi:Flp pilus assembly protein TadB